MTKEIETIITTLEHIHKVQKMLNICMTNIQERLVSHDRSKIFSQELAGFATLDTDISDVTFGSSEYEKVLEQLRDTLDHHYRENSHHPEHFKNGINEMNLLDLLEMTVDWIASAERSNNGNVMTSLPFQKKRYEISDQLFDIIKNTILFIDSK